MPRDIACTQCSETFTRTTTLRRHVRNFHSAAAQRLPCADCPKTFSRKDLLDRHSISHSGLGKKACSICSRRFRPDYLPHHERTCARKTKSRCAKIQAARGSNEDPGAPKHRSKAVKLRWGTEPSPSHQAVDSSWRTTATSTLSIVPSVYSYENLQQWLLVEQAETAIEDGDSMQFDEFLRNLDRANITIHQLQAFMKTACMSSDRIYTSLLALAADKSAPRIVESILTKGVDVDEQDDEGCTALHFAEDLNCARVFLRAGTRMDLKSYAGNTPLSFAVYDGDLARASCLLDAGARVDFREEWWHHGPIGFAILRHYNDMFKLLLNAAIASGLALNPILEEAITYGTAAMTSMLYGHRARLDPASSVCQNLLRKARGEMTVDCTTSETYDDALEKVKILFPQGDAFLLIHDTIELGLTYEGSREGASQLPAQSLLKAGSTHMRSAQPTLGVEAIAPSVEPAFATQEVTGSNDSVQVDDIFDSRPNHLTLDQSTRPYLEQFARIGHIPRSGSVHPTRNDLERTINAILVSETDAADHRVAAAEMQSASREYLLQVLHGLKAARGEGIILRHLRYFLLTLHRSSADVAPFESAHQCLLDCGWNIHQKIDAFSALHCAVRLQHPKAVEWLLDHGGDVNELTDEKPARSALAIAAAGDDIETLELLLHRGAKADGQRLILELSPLTAAVDGRSAKVVRSLLAAGASIYLEHDEEEVMRLYRLAGGEGSVETFCAAEVHDRRSLEAIREDDSVRAGRIQTAPTSSYVTLDYALWETAPDGRIDIAQLLLNKGADPNQVFGIVLPADMSSKDIIPIVCREGPCVTTTLAISALHNHISVTKLLLSHGGRVDGFGFLNELTPLTAALACGHDDIVKILLDAGATIRPEHQGNAVLQRCLATSRPLSSLVSPIPSASIDASEDPTALPRPQNPGEQHLGPTEGRLYRDPGAPRP